MSCIFCIYTSTYTPTHAYDYAETLSAIKFPKPSIIEDMERSMRRYYALYLATLAGVSECVNFNITSVHENVLRMKYVAII